MTGTFADDISLLLKYPPLPTVAGALGEVFAVVLSEDLGYLISR